MIEKFNFYDIYGYFLPGLAFLGVLWLPFALVGHVVPPAGWSSAIILGAAVYILGHLLQAVATSDLPSTIPDRQGTVRYPSDIALDADSDLPRELKGKIGTFVKDQFGLDLRVNESSDAENDKRRNAAFFLARQVLIREKSVSYAEQFQGMYALMRGLYVVFSLALSYWLGWAACTLRNGFLLAVLVIVLTIALLVLINVSLQLAFASRAGNRDDAKRWADRKKKCLWVYLLLFFTIGYAAGYPYKVTLFHAGELSLLAGLAVLARLHTFNAYRYFARNFAITVWRDFLAHNAKNALDFRGEVQNGD